MNKRKTDAVSPLPSLRRSLPKDDHHAARFNRRLIQILRDPLSRFLEDVGAELGTSRPVADDPERVVIHVAAGRLLALRHVLLLLIWCAFTTEHPEVGSTTATREFVRWMRRHEIQGSKSNLYLHLKTFKRGGLEALIPKWNGGRRRRIPCRERALVEAIFLGKDRYRTYQLAHTGAGLPDPCVSRSSAYRVGRRLSKRLASRLRPQMASAARRMR